MKNYYLSTLLMLAQPCFATDPLGELIDQLDSVDSVRCEEMSREQLADHCTREVCGPPGRKTTRLTAKNIHKFLTPEQMQDLKKIETDVANLFKKKEQKIKEMIGELEKRQNDPNFKNTDQWEDHQYANFANFFWGYIDWDIDASRPLRQRGLITVDSSAPDYLIEGINEYAEEFRKSVYNDPLYAYDSGIYNEEELKDAILEKAEKLKKELPSFDINQYKKELIGLSDKEEIASHLAKIESLANDSGIVITPVSFYCLEKCKSSINKFIKNFDVTDTINNLKMTLATLDAKDKIAQCKSNYISVNQQNNLSENFQKIWPEVKSAYEKNVLPRFSEHSRKMMQDYLNNGIHFYFDNPTYDQFPDLNKMMDETTKDKEPLAKKKNPDVLSDLIGNYFDHELGTVVSDIKICETSYPSLIWDSYLAKESILPFSPSYLDKNKDNISVSPFSCEHHREGAGVVAHELGHAMSVLMSRPGMSESSLQGYRSIRSCATAQWDVNDKTERIYHPNDKLFTEEDTADILSYMAVNDGKSLYACGFLSTDDEENEYNDFTTEPWGDNHSPSFIRLLREISYKRSSIPDSCKQIMAKNQDKLGDKKCF